MSAKEEIWELTTDSRVSVTVEGPQGRDRTITAKGKGGRVRIKPEAREIAEERMRKPELNPFRNGMLVQITSDGEALPVEPDSGALPDDDLLELLNLGEEDFEAAVLDLGEVNVRRTLALAKGANAGIVHVKVLEDVIRERYSVGGSTRTYEAMMAPPSM